MYEAYVVRRYKVCQADLSCRSLSYDCSATLTISESLAERSTVFNLQSMSSLALH